MTWRNRLALLLGAASPFALADPAAGQALAAAVRPDNNPDAPAVLQPLEFWSDPAHAGHLLQLAGHSSHRSHSSHASHVSGSGGHSSHYSGSGGGLYIPPAPVYTAPPRPAPPPAKRTPAPLYSTPSAKAKPKPNTPFPALADRLSQDDIAKFVQRVQIALMVKGYDPGPADGTLNEMTQAALMAFQTDSNLPASGNMDMKTLHALGVLK